MKEFTNSNLFIRSRSKFEIFFRNKGRILNLSVSIILFSFMVNCSGAKVLDIAKEEIRIQNISVDKKSFLLTTYKPKTPNGKNLFLFDPIFLQTENLFGYSKNPIELTDLKSAHKSLRIEDLEYEQNSTAYLIPFLLDSGFQIHLLKLEKLEDLESKTSTKAITDSLILLKKEGVTSIGLLGVSLGGQKIASFLQTYSPNETIPAINKIAFLGTGLDYNYTNSLGSKVDKKSINCDPKIKENLCNMYTTSGYRAKDKKIHSYPVTIPKLENDPLKNFSELTKKGIPILAIYGKLDGVSPEESVVAPFFPGRKNKDSKIEIFEASTANGLEKDFDHFDLFLHETTRGGIFALLKDWY